ncbi:MAG: dimethylamine corrinoid protein 3 [Candidatus Aminicenantes bacterium]|nr:MAG: dimethylamine corrinoid protein 3 [Candidatus Aminicenantes bacterium]HHF43045.1 dimethylamine corrinoid protein 3 [Candidatus Aminicenantes bacterium]
MDEKQKQQLWTKMKEAVIKGDNQAAVELAKEAIQLKLDLTETIEKGFVPGIRRVGQLWEEGEYFLPELISSAECMKQAMAVLQPELTKNKDSLETKARIVIGTVEGDIHDIGKNLVSSMLQANGFEIIDLGADVKLEKFIATAQEKKADFICLSALLTTTMTGQQRLIEMLKEQRLREKFKVVVGGAPVTAQWAESIGADGYGENALAAVRIIEQLTRQRREK